MHKLFYVIPGLFLLLSMNTIAEASTMKISSPSFQDHQPIPKKFTCQDQDMSPELVIEGTPKEAKSLTLIVDDPDAPMGIWVHWVVYDIPPATQKIAESAVPGKQGINDFHKINYGGPCPPSGVHRYFFKVYALDTMLNLPEGKSKKDIEQAMNGHILVKAEFVGTYKKE